MAIVSTIGCSGSTLTHEDADEADACDEALGKLALTSGVVLGTLGAEVPFILRPNFSAICTLVGTAATKLTLNSCWGFGGKAALVTLVVTWDDDDDGEPMVGEFVVNGLSLFSTGGLFAGNGDDGLLGD